MSIKQKLIQAQSRVSSDVVRMRVWVDLTNSPHVLVFRPLIRLLRERGHEVEVTAREYAQTMQLLELHGIEATSVGQPRRRLRARQGARRDLARAGAPAAGRSRAASTSRSRTARTT